MKKFLLILLSLILILLPSCNRVDAKNKDKSSTVDSDNGYVFQNSSVEITEEQKEEIAGIIQHGGRCTFSEMEGNVEVTNAYWGDNGYHTSFWKGSFVHQGFPTNDIVAFSEEFFFPNEEGNYIYLLFRHPRDDDGYLIENCLGANFDNGVLTFSIEEKEPNLSEGTAINIAIFKIKKESLPGEIKEIRVEIIQTWRDDEKYSNWFQ